MVPKISLTGKRYGRLVAISRVDGTIGNSKWLCHCDCGNFVDVAIGSLKKGATKSCGCLQKEEQSKKMKTHGLSNTSEYKSWCMMIRRCTKPEDKSYKNYGERGITVCERWVNDFNLFLSDMGPSNGLTIDRIDFDGNYEPKNCRWANRETQNNNRRDNILVDLNDGFGLMSMKQHCVRLGISYTMVRARIQRGWNKEEAFLIPKKNKSV